MEELFKSLFKALEDRNGALAENRVADITNKFLVDLEQPDSEWYVLTVFNSQEGILKFVEGASVSSVQRTFDKATKKALALVDTLVKDFPVLVREYQTEIVRTCRYVTRAGTYLTKVKALETLEMVFSTPSVNPRPENIAVIWEVLKDKSKETTDTVYKTALKIMGVLLEAHPASISREDRERLTEDFIKSLTVNKQSVNESTFHAITNFLKFTEVPESSVARLFSVIRGYCRLSFKSNSDCKYNQHVRLSVNRAALDLLAQHGGLFSEFIFGDCEGLERDLLEWLGLENADNLKAGAAAVGAVYRELGEACCRSGIEAKRALGRIVDHLQTKVRRRGFKSNVMSVYVRGLGNMAGAVKVHFDWLAGNIFVMLKQQIEFCYELKVIDEAKDLENLHDYLYALSNYVFVLTKIDRNQEIALQRVCCLMVRIFHRLSPAHHRLSSDTFFLVLHVIYKKGGSDKLGEFLVDVVEGCVKWSCSHYVALEVENLLEDGSGLCTYKKFLPFWHGVLKWNKSSAHRVSTDERDLIKTLLFDELIRTLFTLINKLNINIQEKNADSTVTDLQEFYEASKKSDYNIFVNITDLYAELLLGLDVVLFKKWVMYFFQRITKQCVKHPLVSGFYNLTAAALHLTEKLDYFNPKRMKRPEVRATFNALVKLLHSILNSVHEYKDVLLTSCLHVILAAPVCLIDASDADFSETFVVCFNLAQTNYPLGVKALATLSKWKEHGDIKPLLKKTLPRLDTVLRTRSLLARKTDATVAKYITNVRRRRIVVEAEPELLELQRGILCFLAQMDGDVCWEYVNANATIATGGVCADGPCLRFPLFQDKMDLHLDALVPRVVEQALHCSDRKLKVNACELLHAMAIIMLGPSVNMTDSDELFKSITSAIITLAVDSDSTINTLFSLLCKQMMRWYASDKQLASKQTRMLIDILLDSIANANNAKIRDHSGACLKVFVNWSKRTRNNADNLNVADILDKLKYYGTHPDRAKRLGAASIFNHVHAELREEEKFINLYWLELLRVFVVNLSTMSDGSDGYCLRQVNAALNNVKRVLVERRALFEARVDESKRPIPAGFRGNRLEDACVFLLEKTRSLNAHCRKKCMELYGDLAESNTHAFNLSDYKHSLNAHGDIASCANAEERLSWLNSLRCYMDGYVFALNQRFEFNEDEALVVVSDYFKQTRTHYDLTGLTAEKIEDTKHARVVLVEENLRLANILLERNKTPPVYFNADLNAFFIWCIFEQHKHTIDYAHRDEIHAQLARLFASLPRDLHRAFSAQAEAYVVQRFNKASRTFLEGVAFLRAANFQPDLNASLKGAAAEICADLLDGNTVKILHPNALDTQKLLLELALGDNEEFRCAVARVCDLTRYTNAETGEEIAYGLHFFHLFKPVLIKSIAPAANFNIFMGELLNVRDYKTHHELVSQIVATVLKNPREFGDEIARGLVEVYAGYWTHIKDWFECDVERCTLGLQMVEQLAELQRGDSAVLLDWVLDVFYTDLDEFHGNDVVFNFYNQRVFVLGLLAGGNAENPRITDAMKHIRGAYAELLNKESTRTSKTLLIRTYFEAADFSKSCAILKEALSIHIAYENDYEPRNLLQRYFKNTDCATQTNTLLSVYEVLGEDVELTRLFTALLQTCEQGVFEEFYAGVIVDVVAALEDGKPVACLLLEAMFSRIDMGKVDGKSCPITHRLLEGNVATGKEMLKRLLGLLRDVYKTDAPVEFKCCAYNAFVALICNTQKEPSAYQMLFKRGESAGALWNKLVADGGGFDFDLRNKAVLSYREVYVKIRGENRDARSEKYIESQDLFASSLCDDIGRHDFTHATIRDDVDSLHNLSVRLTNEDVDRHACMGPLCGVIKHMHAKDIASKDCVVAPLRKALLEDNVNANARVFLVKVVENSRAFLKEHAKLLVGPIMKVVADGCAGACINSFVVDVMDMLLTDWSDAGILPEDKTQINRTLEFLMEHVDSDVSEIFKYNLGLLKTFVEKWRDDIVVPVGAIMHRLNNSCDAEMEQQPRIIVHVINILLGNDLEPWGESMKLFSLRLSAIMRNKHKTVYRQCAETVSLVLRYVSENALIRGKLGALVKLIKGEIEAITDIDKWAHCMEALSKHYPDICGDYMGKVVRMVADTSVKTTEVFLRILARCSGSLARDELAQLLEHSDEDVLVITLEMAKRLIESGQREEIAPILTKVHALVNSNKVAIRNGVYDVSIAAYERFKNEPLIYEACKRVLLQGLLEKNAELQNRIFDFWLSIEELNTNARDKLLYLLRNVYTPEIEENFLGYSASIMLSNLHTNVQEKLHAKPLHKCQFEPLQLSVHWKAQHSDQVPLFASSLSQGEILATQTLNFVPTQNLQAQKETLIAGTSCMLTATQLFKNPNVHDVARKYQLFRKRFNKDKLDDRKVHAERNVAKNFMEKSKRVEATKKRDRSVRIYRTYMRGDYPDIEIPRRDVLDPLKELAKNDPLIARILFTLIFDALNGSGGGDDFVRNTGAAIDAIFEKSTSHTAPLMATFLDIAVKYKETVTFNPRAIGRISQNSRLLSLGANLLEEYLLDFGQRADAPSSKRTRYDFYDDTESVLWIKLAELYKEMDDWDVVSTIFTNKLGTCGSALKAIEHEARGEWKLASAEYKKVIADADADRRDFYFESLSRAFSELTSWSELAKYTEEIVEGENAWDALWTDEWNRKKLLPGYMKARLRETETRGAFFEQIASDLKDQTRAVYLKEHHSEELAFVRVLQDKMPDAKVHLDAWIKAFLQNWSCLSPLFSMVRGRDLIAARNALDMYIFVTTRRDGDCYKHWESSADDETIAFVECEARNFHRKEFARVLKLTSNQEETALINNLLFKLDVKMCELALKKGNFDVAKKYFKTYTHIAKNPANGLSYVKLNLLLGKLYYLSAQIKPSSALKDLKVSITKTNDCLQNSEIHQDPLLMLESALLYFNYVNEFHELSTSSSNSENQATAILHQLDVRSADELKTTGKNHLINALSTCERIAHKTPRLIRETGNCYYRLACYACRSNDVDYIRFTLRAMLYESREAVTMFPRLLNLEDLCAGVAKQTFTEESSALPAWMFIKWTPQLLAFVDTNRVACIADIITRIAREYPYSIIYAYKLSKNQYKYAHELKEESQRLCERLDAILDNPPVEKMLNALYCVVKPEIFLETALNNWQKSLDPPTEQYKRAGRDMLDKLYNSPSPRGTRCYNLLDRHKKHLEKLVFGDYTVEKIKAELSKIVDDIRTAPRNEHDYLECYSPWLENFKAANAEHEIEIPGQYTGDGKPLDRYHVKLAGFDRQLYVLASKRKPIRIKMLGSDTKEYPFLVKYGEDLRQDQRIQQMFKLINDILAGDPLHSRQKLRIVTFEVIPLRADFGLIEWLDGTQKMSDFVNSAMSKGELTRVDRLGSDYVAGLQKCESRSKSGNNLSFYEAALMKNDKTKTKAAYNSLVNKVPKGLLRKAFYKISGDTESLFALKQSFVRSYSTQCVAGWLLGIGDRHLSNVLLAVKTGEAVGIDFGIAFGTATRQLIVPELVPFRLTPVITDLTQPHGVDGMFKRVMVRVLESLRGNKEALLAVLDVFIREPMMDWLGDERVKGRGEWLPQERIAAARRKIDGVNPCEVMVDEVLHRDNPETTKLKLAELLRGDSADLRFKTAREGLSAEEQITCLLDQATDANLLGRMFHGWTPWL